MRAGEACFSTGVQQNAHGLINGICTTGHTALPPESREFTEGSYLKEAHGKSMKNFMLKKRGK